MKFSVVIFIVALAFLVGCSDKEEDTKVVASKVKIVEQKNQVEELEILEQKKLEQENLLAQEKKLKELKAKKERERRLQAKREKKKAQELLKKKKAQEHQSKPFIVKKKQKVVVDDVTKLMWQDNGDAKTTEKNWVEAKKYCTNLVLEKYNDWRLPNYNELVSIVNYKKYPIAANSNFKNIAPEFYWSSASSKVDSLHAWGVYFNYGYTYDYVKSEKYNVRCVRGTAQVPKKISKLQWQDNKDVKKIKKDWQSAKGYCKSLKFDNKNNWRLPSIKELESIVDITKYDNVLSDKLSHAVSKNYWSRTSTFVDNTNAWKIDFRDGNLNYNYKTAQYYVRCVREENP